jgi:hypothetical protein
VRGRGEKQCQRVALLRTCCRFHPRGYFPCRRLRDPTVEVFFFFKRLPPKLRRRVCNSASHKSKYGVRSTEGEFHSSGKEAEFRMKRKRKEKRRNNQNLDEHGKHLVVFRVFFWADTRTYVDCISFHEVRRGVTLRSPPSDGLICSPTSCILLFDLLLLGSSLTTRTAGPLFQAPAPAPAPTPTNSSPAPWAATALVALQFRHLWLVRSAGVCRWNCLVHSFHWVCWVCDVSFSLCCILLCTFRTCTSLLF